MRQAALVAKTAGNWKRRSTLSVCKGRPVPGKKGKKTLMDKLKSGEKIPRRNGSSDPLGANSEIGRKLKQYYDELVSDEVPDRFAQLLSQLEMAEPARKKD